MEEQFDLGTGLTIISIILEDDVEPKIDLDGCHPLVAANIFRNAADMLEAMPMRPTISTLGQIIACDDEIFFLDLDDED